MFFYYSQPHHFLGGALGLTFFFFFFSLLPFCSLFAMICSFLEKNRTVTSHYIQSPIH